MSLLTKPVLTHSLIWGESILPPTIPPPIFIYLFFYFFNIYTYISPFSLAATRSHASIENLQIMVRDFLKPYLTELHLNPSSNLGYLTTWEFWPFFSHVHYTRLSLKSETILSFLHYWSLYENNKKKTNIESERCDDVQIVIVAKVCDWWWWCLCESVCKPRWSVGTKLI